MADLTEAYSALQKADAAGDTAGAKQLADYIRSQQATPQAPQAQQPQTGYGMTDFLAAVPETLAHMGSSMVAAPVAGWRGLGTLAGNALGLTSADPADAVRSTQNALTYQPHTRGGQLASSIAGYLPGKYGQFADWAGGKVSDATGSPALGTAVNTGIQGLPLLIGAGSKLFGKSAAPEAAAPDISPEVAEATGAGLKLTPEQAQSGMIGRIVQSLTGSAKLERSLSRANAPNVNDLAAEDIGLPPGTTLTPKALETAKAPHFAVYEAAKGVGDVPLDPEAFNVASTAGTLRNADAEALQQHYAGLGTINAKDLLADVQDLRAAGGKNIRAPYAPAQNSLGRAQRAISEALESQLDQHLQGMGDSAPVSIEAYRAARTQLAKINAVEDALDATNVSPKAIASQPYQSGNLKIIANAYNNYPRSLQDISSLRDSGPFGVLDLGFGAAAGFAHPAATAAVLARPLARGFLASDLYQKAAIAGQTPAFLGPSSPGLIGSAYALPEVTQQQRYGLPSPDYLLK